MAIQDDIDILQAQIDAIRGNVPEVAPASCNITDLETEITLLAEQIRDLRTAKVEEDNPFSGTTMSLRLDTRNNMPSLTGNNPAAVALINAIGVKPAAVTMDDVTVSVSGGSSIVVSVVGETDVVVATRKLIEFAVDKGVTIDATQVQTTKSGNIDKAGQYSAMARSQEDILTTLTEGGALLVPMQPDIGYLHVVVDHNTIGVILFPVRYTGGALDTNIDWGDGNIDEGVDLSTYNVHGYAAYGEYVITVIAPSSSDTGSGTRTCRIVLRDPA